MIPGPDFGYYMLIMIASMAISMTITPLMMRYASRLRMVDEPDHRKVHTAIIPRVGGVGIVIGFLTPVFVLLPADELTTSILLGTLILLAFGIWDDIKPLRPWVKFIGQIIATLVVVYLGGLYVHHFPLLGIDSIPEPVGKAFTVFAILGIINAVNLSDGLDGLAGGEVLISMMVIGYMAFSYDGYTAVVLAVATIGGIFGFLRYNSHPAMVFMGDSGSQSLGYLLAILVVYLTQNINPVLSPALPVLLLGLPLIDSLAVFFMRARRGDSLVVAAKDHLHHRLLSLGFHHYESVMIIYTAQIIMVSSALVLPYESDLLILGVYLLMCAVIYASLVIAERSGWRMHKSADGAVKTLGRIIRENRLLSALPARALEAGLSVFLLAACLMSETIPVDFGLSAVLLLVTLAAMLLSRRTSLLAYKLIVYVLVGFSVYLLSSYPPPWILEQIELAYLFYTVVSLAIIVAVRASNAEHRFRITPMDFLLVVCVLLFLLVSGGDVSMLRYLWIGVQMLILFYAAEFLIENKSNLYNRFSGVLCVVMLIFIVRGLL